MISNQEPLQRGKATVLRLGIREEASELTQQSWYLVAKTKNRLASEENERGKEAFGVFYGT